MSGKDRRLRAVSDSATRHDAIFVAAEAAAHELFDQLHPQSPVEPGDIATGNVRRRVLGLEEWRFTLGVNSIDDLPYFDREEWLVICYGPTAALRLDAYVCVCRGVFRRARYEYRDDAWSLITQGSDAA